MRPSSKPQDMGSERPSLTIATLNVRCLAVYMHRAIIVAREMGADVVCFQEADVCAGGEDAIEATARSAGYISVEFGEYSNGVVRVVTISKVA
jgi:exonuclease III